jgi:GTP-binding protein HflX
MELLFEKLVPIRVRLPFTEGALIALFHEEGIVELVENETGGL